MPSKLYYIGRVHDNFFILLPTSRICMRRISLFRATAHVPQVPKQNNVHNEGFLNKEFLHNWSYTKKWTQSSIEIHIFIPLSDFYEQVLDKTLWTKIWILHFVQHRLRRVLNPLHLETGDPRCDWKNNTGAFEMFVEFIEMQSVASFKTIGANTGGRPFPGNGRKGGRIGEGWILRLLFYSQLGQSLTSKIESWERFQDFSCY